MHQTKIELTCTHHYYFLPSSNETRAFTAATRPLYDDRVNSGARTYPTPVDRRADRGPTAACK
jgi:hypothetical protein